VELKLVKIKHSPQLEHKEVFVPIDELSSEEVKKLPLKKPLNCEVDVIDDLPSYNLMQLYRGCCTKVAENTDDINWNTKEKVDYQCKMICGLVKEIGFNPETNEIKLKPISISFKNLSEIKRYNYIESALEVMANKLGITKEELKKEI